LVLSTEVLSDFFDTDATFTIDDDNDFFATLTPQRFGRI